MFTSSRFMFMCLVLAIAAATAASAQPFRRQLVPGRVVLRARAGCEPTALRQRIELAGGQVRGEIRRLGLTVVAVPNSTEDETASFLAAQQDVGMAAPVYRYRSLLLPNDPQFPNQGHHQVIGSQAAWDLGTGSTAITIAVLDTGVSAHPDLASKLLAGFNFFDNNTNASDVEGHGTLVAGVAAAIGNNGIGVAGMAWQNRVLPVRISSPQGFADSDTIAAAMQFAVDNGARVINCSFGPLQGDQIIYQATRYVQSRGGAVYVSAGNDGTRDSTPEEASIDFVSATDDLDRRASFTTTGPAVTLSAPGVSILTTTRSGGLARASGTSFSSPMAAGLAALVWSTNPGLTNTQVRGILKSTARDLGTVGRDETFGFGRIDAAAAMRSARNIPPPAPDTTAPAVNIASPTSGTTVTDQVTITVNATDAVGVTAVSLLLDGRELASDAFPPFAFVLRTSTLRTGAHTLQAKARDAAGNVGSSAIVTIQVATPSPQLVITFPRAGFIWNTKQLDVEWAGSRNAGFHHAVALLDGVEVGRQRSFQRRNSSFTRGVIRITAPTGLSLGAHLLEVQALTFDGQSFTSPSVKITRK